MNLTAFMFTFFIMVLVSSIFINGWYAITRGRWETKPNGEKYWVGKIFSGWHKFFQQHKERTVYYENGGFLNQWQKVSGFFRSEAIIEVFKTSAHVMMLEKDIDKLLIYARSCGVNASVRKYERENEYLVSIYTVVKDYRFSDLIKDPLALCITCFASIYGALIWAFWMYVFTKIDGQHGLEGSNFFIDVPLKVNLLMMVVFCISLSYVNEFLNHANQKLKT